MARKAYQNHFADGNGRVVTEGTVTVYEQGGTTLATIYSTDVIVTAITGSVITTDSTDGSFKFFIDPDDYDYGQEFKIVLSKTNFRTQTYENVRIFGFWDGVTADADELNILDGATLDVGDINLLAGADDAGVTAAKIQLLAGAAALSGSNTGDEVAATTTVAGKSELATSGELKAETDTGRTVTPSALGDWALAFKNVISGLVVSNGTDAEHDVDISAGYCRDVANTRFLYSGAMTKQIDANWAAGTDAGGFPSGLTLANSTWYRVFAIYDVANDLVDYGFDTSATAANLLSDASDYTLYRQIDWKLTDGSSNILGSQQFEKAGGSVECYWDDPPRDVDIASLAETSTAISLSVPDETCEVKLNINMDSSGAASALIIAPTTGICTNTAIGVLLTEDESTHLVSTVTRTDSSGQIFIRGSNTNINNLDIETVSFTMERLA